MKKNQIVFFALLLIMGLSACGGSGNNPDAPTPTVSSKDNDDMQQSQAQYVVNKEAVPSCETPKTLKDLNSGLKQLFYEMTSNNAANLSLFGMGNIDLSKKQKMVIVDYIQFKDLSCEEKPLRYGVGARLFLHIKKVKAGINVMKLPELAAAVETGKASVTYSIETVGVTGDKIQMVLPEAGDFNVGAYGKITNAVDEIRKLMRDNTEGVNITPQLIPTEVKK